MRRIAICMGLLLGLCAYSAGQQPSLYRGEISDSQCALNVHSLTKSHEEMLKSKSGAAGQTAASCSLYCIMQLGGRFVLVSKGNVYHLDDQEHPRALVGEKVRIHGILDQKTDTLHVIDISKE